MMNNLDDMMKEVNNEFYTAGCGAATADFQVGESIFSLDKNAGIPQVRPQVFPLRFDGTALIPEGGLAYIFGQKKTGKSSVLFSLIESIHGKGDMPWEANFNKETDIYLHFEMEEEESEIDTRMFDVFEDSNCPLWFKYYPINNRRPEHRKQIIEQAVLRFTKFQSKRIWLSLNQLHNLSKNGTLDEPAAIDCLDWIKGLNTYATIVTTQDNTSLAAKTKPTGLLGRELEWRAQGGLITSKKDGRRFVEVYDEGCRYAKELPRKFEFTDLIARRVSVEKNSQEKRLDEYKVLVKQAYTNAGVTSFDSQNDLAEAIANVSGCTASNAKKTIIPPLVDKGFIRKPAGSRKHELSESE